MTLGVTVTGYRAPQAGAGRRPFRVLVEDPTGDITLVFFGMPQARVEKMLPLGSHRYITGRIDLWDGHRQMVHPARIVDEAGLAAQPTVEPIYGATEGLTSRAISKLAHAALERLPVLPEWQDPAWIAREGLPAFADALRAEHRPESAPPPVPEGRHRPAAHAGPAAPRLRRTPRLAAGARPDARPQTGARRAGPMRATAP